MPNALPSTAPNIAERFIDPVTYDIMVDPVVCSDGYTYDRATAQRMDKSPFTREPLRILVDNVALRGDIFEAHPQVARAYHDAKAAAPRPMPLVPQPNRIAPVAAPQALALPRVEGRAPTYTGAYLNGRYHGQGTLRWPGGEVFEGHLENGLATGRGRYVVKPGFLDDMFRNMCASVNCDPTTVAGVYDGDFRHGLPHGDGTYTWESGQTFSGTWKEGHLEQGMLRFCNGDTFLGQFVGDEMRTGRYTWRNGDYIVANMEQVQNASAPQQRSSGAMMKLRNQTYNGWIERRRFAYKGHVFTHHLDIPRLRNLPAMVYSRIRVAQVDRVVGRGG